MSTIASSGLIPTLVATSLIPVPVAPALGKESPQSWPIQRKNGKDIFNRSLASTLLLLTAPRALLLTPELAAQLTMVRTRAIPGLFHPLIQSRLVTGTSTALPHANSSSLQPHAPRPIRLPVAVDLTKPDSRSSSPSRRRRLEPLTPLTTGSPGIGGGSSGDPSVGRRDGKRFSTSFNCHDDLINSTKPSLRLIRDEIRRTLIRRIYTTPWANSAWTMRPSFVTTARPVVCIFSVQRNGPTDVQKAGFGTCDSLLAIWAQLNLAHRHFPPARVWPPIERPVERARAMFANDFGVQLPTTDEQGMLLDIYFTHINPAFPLFHRDAFMKAWGMGIDES